MKSQMFDYINNNIVFISNVENVLNKRGVLRFLRRDLEGNVLNLTELKQHTDICYLCTRILNWLSKINLESCAEDFGISDFYSFRDDMCDLNEVFDSMIEYYEMCTDGKFPNKSRQLLESIPDREKFVEAFRDEKSSLIAESNADVIAPPVKILNGPNLYIEVGPKSFLCKGFRNNSIKETQEYKRFKADKSLDNLMGLLRTGEVETLFKGCISFEDYEVFSEIAEAELELRKDQAHYCSLKMVLNKSKYDKIASVVEPGTFLLLYSMIDDLGDEVCCEYSGMDIEVSKTKFRNYSGIHKGTYSDRRGTYNFIVDTNVD